MRALRNIFFVVAVLSSAASVAQPSAGLSEGFDTMTLRGLVTFSRLISCYGTNPNGNDPEDVSMILPGGTEPWTFLASSGYPLTWQATCTSSQTAGCTQAWALNAGSSPSANGILYTHAQNEPGGDGHAFLSRQAFDRSHYLTATIRMSPDHCQDGAQGCFAGFTLLASEADYREIAFLSTGTKNALGQELYWVGRWAPCDYRYFTDANNNVVTVAGSTFHTVRLDYLGPEGGSWRYYVDGVELRMIDENGVLNAGERGTAWKARLNDDPHVGMYWSAPTGKYFEGRMDDLVVHQLEKVVPVSTSAKSSYAGTPPTSAADGDPNTQWNAGGYAPSWIEFDLGSTVEVKKLRLLTSQWPSGPTTHNIYVGNTPAPTTLFKSLQGSTTDNVWLDVDLIGAGANGRYVRVETTSSPGWVAWREIEVYR